MTKNKKEILVNLEKLTKGKKSSWVEDAQYRVDNQKWIKRSQLIALKILRTLRTNKLSQKQPYTQKQLADKLELSPQQINKWVKGNENFTLETISKIENILKIDLIHIVKSQSAVSHNSIIIPQVYSDRPKTSFEKRSRKKKGKVIPINRTNVWSSTKKYAYQ